MPSWQIRQTPEIARPESLPRLLSSSDHAAWLSHHHRHGHHQRRRQDGTVFGVHRAVELGGRRTRCDFEDVSRMSPSRISVRRKRTCRGGIRPKYDEQSPCGEPRAYGLIDRLGSCIQPCSFSGTFRDRRDGTSKLSDPLQRRYSRNTSIGVLDRWRWML